MSDALTIGGRTFRSRLFVGTGKYADMAQTRAALEASGAEVVTVAVRRVDLAKADAELGKYLLSGGYTILPNTAGCYDVETTLRTARLAREMLGTPLLKLEVTSQRGKGQLTGTTTIQRINTKGGTAEGACETGGAFQSVPYSADYTFLTKGG